MSSSHIPCGTSLGSSVEELGCAALAVGVVGSHTVAHLTVALHACSVHLGGGHQEPVSGLGRDTAPSRGLVHLNIIVISKHITFLDGCVALVQVILYPVVCVSIVADGVGVDVMIDGCAQHVFHGLVMTGVVRAELHTDVETGIGVQLGAQR